MSSFSAEWLALRELADRAARAPAVLEACRRHFAGREEISICDLGAGTGAAVGALTQILPPRQRWLLVDADARNLSLAASAVVADGVQVVARVCDLAAEPAPWPCGCGLVTATALFDLAAPRWIERLCEALARARVPLLATLTYDGVQSFSPEHPADASMLAAFNRHQLLDKGLGGPAAGPEAATMLAETLKRQGFSVERGPSPWLLRTPCDGALIREALTGWASAVTEAGFMRPEVAERWLIERLADTEAMTVSHTDVFATP